MLLTSNTQNCDRTTINFKPTKSPLCKSLQKDRILKKPSTFWAIFTLKYKPNDFELFSIYVPTILQAKLVYSYKI